MLKRAIDEADWPLALDEWRARRAPELADLIDRIGARCTRIEPPRRDQHLWWIAHPYDPVAAITLCALAAIEAAATSAPEVTAWVPDEHIEASRPTEREEVRELWRNALRETASHRELLSLVTLWPGSRLDPRHFAAFVHHMEHVPVTTRFTNDTVTALAAIRSAWPFRTIYFSSWQFEQVVEQTCRIVPELEQLILDVSFPTAALRDVVTSLPARLSRLRKLKLDTGWQFGRFTPEQQAMLVRLAELPFVEIDKRS